MGAFCLLPRSSSLRLLLAMLLRFDMLTYYSSGINSSRDRRGIRHDWPEAYATDDTAA